MNGFVEDGGLGALVGVISVAAACPCLARAARIRARNIAENQEYISKESDRYYSSGSTIIQMSFLLGALVSLVTGANKFRFFFTILYSVFSILFLGMAVYYYTRLPAKNRFYRPDQISASPRSIKTQNSQPIVHCSQCGSTHPLSTRFCSTCGAMLGERNQGGKLCPICGNQGVPGQLFCENCGAMLQ